MGRRRGVMSDRFKEELARELGFYDTVRRARDAGNMVKRAIELAEKQIASGTKQS